MGRCGFLAVIVASALLAGCGHDEPLAAQGPLEAGFARVSIPWRVGAKPGQVGTVESPDHSKFFLEGVGEILPIVNQPPPEMLPEATDWAIGRIDEQVAAAKPGTYSWLFEPGRGIELPPEVNALVVRRGDDKVAIVRADLYVMHEQIQRRVAELVTDATGIGRDQLFLIGTHNHSVPHAVSPAPGVWTRADAFDPRHFVYVTRKIADAIIAADAALEPAELRVARTRLDDVQHNVIGPAEVAARPDEDSESEVVQVGYPVDHFDSDLLMLRFDAPGGAPIGLLFVFGMHPESLQVDHGMTSGEWPTHVQAQLRRELGIEAIWLPGPLGDVEPDGAKVNPEHAFFRGDFETMAEMSELVAGAARDAWQTAGDAQGETRPTFAQIARDVPGPPDYAVPDLAEVGWRLPMVRIAQDSTLMRIHLLRLGDALLVGLPAEITTDLAWNIKSRTDLTADNVYQGYIWPENPDWVRQRVEQNFSTNEVEPGAAVPLPMIVSHANAYFGYVVSRWEYENRDHYRQSMTFFGPGTADHIASAVVAMTNELGGTGAAQFETQSWHPLDLEGAAEIESRLAEFEALVPELSRAIPALSPGEVGVVVETPGVTAPLRFGWLGGTNDMEPPSVVVQEAASDGSWREIASGPSAEIHVLFEPPNRWTALWRKPKPMAGDLRFVARGTYRGAHAGVSKPDPLWDPDGADVSYEVVSGSFRYE